MLDFIKTILFGSLIGTIVIAIIAIVFSVKCINFIMTVAEIIIRVIASYAFTFYPITIALLIILGIRFYKKHKSKKLA